MGQPEGARSRAADQGAAAMSSSGFTEEQLRQQSDVELYLLELVSGNQRPRSQSPTVQSPSRPGASRQGPNGCPGFTGALSIAANSTRRISRNPPATASATSGSSHLTAKSSLRDRSGNGPRLRGAKAIVVYRVGFGIGLPGLQRPKPIMLGNEVEDWIAASFVAHGRASPVMPSNSDNATKAVVRQSTELGLVVMPSLPLA